MTSPKSNLTELEVNFYSSLISGFSTSAIFHPIDRALFLSFANNGFFLKIDNFKNPFHGIKQTVLYKSLGNGMYFFFQGEISSILQSTIPDDTQNRDIIIKLNTGILSGSASSIIIHPLTTIKYYVWGGPNRTFSQSIIPMWNGGGFKPFYNGLKISIMRDSTSAAIYEVTRAWIYNSIFLNNFNKIPESGHFISNFLAATIASILSSPLNYVRMKQLATKPENIADGIVDTLSKLHNDSKQAPKGLYSRLSFFNKELKMGWGTARATLGIAVGQVFFDAAHKQLSNGNSL